MVDLFDLAARQHGVFSLAQAREAGYTRGRIRQLASTGIIELARPSVYRVRAAPRTWEQRLSSACLWLPGSLASHRSAAALRRLRTFGSAPVELITERGRSPRSQRDVILHERKDLASADHDEVDGIACTSLVRTLVDLPAVVTPVRAGEALDHATRRDAKLLERVATRHLELARRGRNGTVALRALLAERGAGDLPVDSGFERRTLALFAAAGLPKPVTQLHVTDGEVVCYLDIAWPHLKVAVECDSLEFHLGERAFRWERVRRRMLLRLGWTILEFTYREVTTDGERVVREVAHHLAEARARQAVLS